MKVSMNKVVHKHLEGNGKSVGSVIKQFEFDILAFYLKLSFLYCILYYKTKGDNNRLKITWIRRHNNHKNKSVVSIVFLDLKV